MNPTPLDIIATIIFTIAVLNTFVAKPIENFAHHCPKGSIRQRILHYFAEVEAVFGIWSAIFIIIYAFIKGFAVYDEHHHVIDGALHYINSQNYTEPAFVFVIMCMAGTKPIIFLAERFIDFVASLLPMNEKKAFYLSALIIGPLLGSFITEPAAMTVTSLLLLKNFYSKSMSKNFMYATIGLLFVNVSVGGTLTHFAAPPVLMVAGKYGWGLWYMFSHFGDKAVVAILISTVIVTYLFRKELAGTTEKSEMKVSMPWWIILVHVLFIGGVVYTAHYMSFFLALFLFFIGFTSITREHQEPLKIRESLLVGFFLAGLVTLGSMQQWWLQVVLTKMSDLALYFGATALTAVTDNAALTYLGSLVELSDSAKYNLVAGAVSGGGLTVIANAPNPAGYGILKDSFGKDGVSPLWLFLGALGPTVIVCLCFQLIP